MSDPEASLPLIPCDSRRPLTLEALRPFVSDPFWVKVRVLTLLSLLAAMLAMLAVAAAEVRNAPPCAVRSPRQVLRVDMDSSGDGADLRGIISKLDYLAEIGVKVVWLSPIYKSPMKDFGYDIEDFQEIDETFGSMADFKELVVEMKKRDLKLVMDLVPNHTSDKHKWFQKSTDRVEPYTSYYLWEPPKKYDETGNPIPPNNWLSVFGGPAWEFSEKRKEFYLHQFGKEQPDLNFRNPMVLKEMLDVARFWLDLGVDGFRLDAIAHIFEDPELRDEPLKEGVNATSTEGYGSFSHIYTHDLPEVMDVVQAFRDCMDEYARNSDGVPRLLMAEVYNTIEETIKYYGNASQPLADFPFNFLFITNLNSSSTAQDVMDIVNLWLRSMPKGMTANWVLGNHDQKRVASRLGPELVDGMHMLLLLLPGTAVTYYGEEIGMEDTLISWKDTVDPAGLNAGEKHYAESSRDPARTPMQWNSQKNAGFSSFNTTWLPINQNYRKVNVEAQKESVSHLNLYKTLVKARITPAIQFGNLEMKVLNSSVFAFTRHYPGSEAYLVAVNWSAEPTEVDFSSFENMAEKATIYAQSINSTKKEKIINNGEGWVPRAAYLCASLKEVARNLQTAIPLLGVIEPESK